MRFNCAVGILLSIPTPIFTLQPPLTNVRPVVGSLLPPNSSTPSFNTSANNLPPIYCDGAKYGVNLDVGSCLDALNYLPYSRKTGALSFGPRAWGRWDVVAPSRYLSCQSPSLAIFVKWYSICWLT